MKQRLSVLALLAVALLPMVIGFSASDYDNVELITNSSQVSGSETNFPYYVDLSVIDSSSFWNNVQSDGGDIRISSTSSAGNSSRLPVDVVSVDTSSETGEIYFKANTSANTNKSYYVWYKTTSGTVSQPATTDTYGRNAVWTEYEAVWHGNNADLVDVTGNGNDGTAQNTPTVVDAKVGKGLEFDDSNSEGVDVGDMSGLEGSTDVTLTAWSNADDYSHTGEPTIMRKWTSSAQSIAMTFDNSDDNLRIFWKDSAGDTTFQTDSDNYATNSWHHVAARYQGDSEIRIFKNGVSQQSTSTNVGSVKDSNVNMGVGFRAGANDQFFDGTLDELRTSTTAFSSNWLTTQYNIQNQNTNFWTQSSAGNLTIKTEDAFDQSSISNFSANLTGQTTGTEYNLTTTSGTITAPVLTNSTETWDVNVSAKSHDNQNFDGVNVSQNTTLTASLADALTTFETSSKVTGSVVAPFNVTINGVTREANQTAVLPTPEDFNATFNKATGGWFNVTNTNLSATCDTVKIGGNPVCDDAETTATTFNPYNHRRKINASEVRNGLRLENFTTNIKGPNNYQATRTVTDGNATFNIEQNVSYTANISNTSDDFATRFQNGTLVMQKSLTPSTTTNTTTFETFTFNSVLFKVFDLDNTTQPLQQQVNITLENGPEDRTLQNKNGTLFTDDLLTGSYDAEITSSGFKPQTYFFSVSQDTTQQINAHLDDTGQRVDFQVVDSRKQSVSGAILTMRNNVNGTLVTVGQKKTGFDGVASFTLDEDKTYEFTVQKQGFQTFRGTVTPVKNTYTVPLSPAAQGQFNNILQGLQIQTNVTSSNNKFNFTFDVTAEDNDLQRAAYNFTYNNTVFQDEVTGQPSGASFDEDNIRIVTTETTVEVRYEVKRQNKTRSFTRTFVVKPVSGQAVNIPLQAGPVTQGVLALIFTSFSAVSLYVVTRQASATAILSALMLGGFAYANMINAVLGTVSATFLVLVVVGRNARRAGA